MVPLDRLLLPAPMRDGLIVAIAVFLAYTVFFATRLFRGYEVDFEGALVQIAFQTVGLGLFAAFWSWVIRALIRW